MAFSEIVESAGLSERAVVALLKVFAGSTVTIPTNPETLLKNAQDLDPVEAKQLCATAGGERVYVGRGCVGLAIDRNSLIRVERANGKSIREIALAYDMSDRQIRRILNNKI